MGKRYGRNQRRKHREQIEGLTEELRLARAYCDQWRLRADVAQSQAEQARWNAQQAEERAFQRFMRASGHLKFIMDRLATEIGHAAGEQLLTEFASVAPPRHPAFTAKCLHDGVQAVRTIELTLPALRVRYALTDRELQDA